MSTMQFYTCKLRLSGELRNEVYKEGVTAPEVIAMRRMHGEDAVTDIKPVNPIVGYEPERIVNGKKKSGKPIYAHWVRRDENGLVLLGDPYEFRDWFIGKYGPGLADQDEDPSDAVVRLFGSEYQPLISELPEFRAFHRKQRAAAGEAEPEHFDEAPQRRASVDDEAADWDEEEEDEEEGEDADFEDEAGEAQRNAAPVIPPVSKTLSLEKAKPIAKAPAKQATGKKTSDPVKVANRRGRTTAKVRDRSKPAAIEGLM